MSTVGDEVLGDVPRPVGALVAELRTRRDAARAGSAGATMRQHARGKLTVRERLALLFDEESFREMGLLRRHQATGFGIEQNRPCTDGVVTGWGRVHGQVVYVYANDFRIQGGSLGKAHAEKIHAVMDLAIETGHPLVALNDGAGARIQEGASALAGYGGIFERHVRASGRVPQISVVLGPCAGGAAYAPALTDFVFVVDGVSQMYVTGPDVVRTVTGESVSHDELGGAAVHAERSGVAHSRYADEATCLEDVRYLLSLLPPNHETAATTYACDDDVERRCPRLTEIVPVDPRESYDIRDVLGEIVDEGEFFEIQQSWARSIVCGFARVGGMPIGIVASQPAFRAGVLDIESSEKAARFVQFCDSFGLPLLTLVDVPGFLPGVDQEHRGIIRHGAKLLYAYCNASVPRVCLVLRKAYGGAYIVMDSKAIGSDLVFAWPMNEIAVMGPEAAVGVLHRKRDLSPSAVDAYVRSFKDEFLNPCYAAERGLVDDVIGPADSRLVIHSAFAALEGKARRPVARHHGNQPV